MRVNILADVAYFLNAVMPEMTPAQWGEFQKVANKRKLLSDVFVTPAFSEQLTLDEAQALRGEIARDLAYRDKNPAMPFARLLGSLNQLGLKTKYQCLSLRLYGKPRPGQVILKVGKTRFVPRIFPEAKTTKELLYVTLSAALMDGSLGRLKTCRFCSKWMVGKNSGKKFCSILCKDNFNNQRRIDSGYYENRRKLIRKRGKLAARRRW